MLNIMQSAEFCRLTCNYMDYIRVLFGGTRVCFCVCAEIRISNLVGKVDFDSKGGE